MIPQKVSVSNFVGTIKGRTAIRIFNKFRRLKRPIGAIISGHKVIAVDTVGLDEEMVRKYIKYQEMKERRSEQK